MIEQYDATMKQHVARENRKADKEAKKEELKIVSSVVTDLLGTTDSQTDQRSTGFYSFNEKACGRSEKKGL